MLCMVFLLNAVTDNMGIQLDWLMGEKGESGYPRFELIAAWWVLFSCAGLIGSLSHIIGRLLSCANLQSFSATV